MSQEAVQQNETFCSQEEMYQVPDSSRPSPQEFYTQRRTMNNHVTKKLRPAPPTSRYMTQRCGTPLPPPARTDKPLAINLCRTSKKQVSQEEYVEAEPVMASQSPRIVEYPAEASLNKGVHVQDRRHRGQSRNDLGGFFTS